LLFPALAVNAGDVPVPRRNELARQRTEKIDSCSKSRILSGRQDAWNSDISRRDVAMHFRFIGTRLANAFYWRIDSSGKVRERQMETLLASGAQPAGKDFPDLPFHDAGASAQRGNATGPACGQGAAGAERRSGRKLDAHPAHARMSLARIVAE